MARPANKMVRLTKDQIKQKLRFVKNYVHASNAADGSTFDPNSNVITKNVATMAAELNKDINIQVKRALVCEKLVELFGQELADKYIEQLEKHEIYTHDETTIAPYCVAVSMYPFLTDGLKAFGGESKAPKHLSSYNGGFVNLIFALSAQFCGAVATVEYLMCFDHFAKKDYGEDYLATHRGVIEQELQQVVYALNQPASARNYQSPFWNISVFDRNYFEALFGNFTFPDGSKPSWESLDKLQRYFMHWFNQERTKALLTFPVVTVSVLHDGTELIDKDYESFICNEISEGNSFFIYSSDTADSLSSCCRLKNVITDQINDFSYSLGAGGVMTGSINVMTLNLNRFIQDTFRLNGGTWKGSESDFAYLEYRLKAQIKLMHCYQMGFRMLFKEFEEQGLLPAYTAHYIELNKQYATIGINGLMEGAEFLGYEPSNNKEYTSFVSFVLKCISDQNKETSKKYGIKLNTECVPAESLGVKFANWDKKDNYVVKRDCYNSYFYPVEDESLTIIDKFNLHGFTTTRYLDGGSALHLNLEDYPTPATFKKILDVAVQTGCPYFCTNVKVTICNECGYIDKQTRNQCVKCGSKDIDYATRVIGYLRRVSNFSTERQQEEHRRYYHVSSGKHS